MDCISEAMHERRRRIYERRLMRFEACCMRDGIRCCHDVTSWFESQQVLMPEGGWPAAHIEHFLEAEAEPHGRSVGRACLTIHVDDYSCEGASIDA